jgi:hypothetical protein
MNSPAKQLSITHQCQNCQHHHPAHLVYQAMAFGESGGMLKCPNCGSSDLQELQDLLPDNCLPRFHAKQAFERSAFTYAHEHGIDGPELDGLAQAVFRLGKHSSTVITKHQAHALSTAKELGYLNFVPTEQGTVEAELLVPGALFSSYFWSVWVPQYLQSRNYQTAIMPGLAPGQVAQYCSVAFRIPGSREAARLFLGDLAERFSDRSHAEIIHLEAGNAFERTADASAFPRAGRGS